MINQKNNEEEHIEAIKNSVVLSDSFRQNIWKYAEEKNMTIVDLANNSQIPINTINSFLHRISNDMKISNVARIAKTLGVSIDELVGAGTISPLSLESLAMCRDLPENDLYLVRWFIRYLHALNAKIEPNKRCISVMLPSVDNDGNLKITSDYEKTDVSNLKEPLRSKVFMGVKLNCDNYMPHYLPSDVLLIANDRAPSPNENCLVRVGKYLFIVKQKSENGTVKYYSIRDGKYRVDSSEIDELIGYIAL